MTPAIDSSALGRLLDLGRNQGHLTTDDLRRALPIDAMGADEVALVVAHLEDAGVAVEIDENLFAPHPDARPTQPRGAEIMPLPGRSEPRAENRPRAAASAPAEPSRTPVLAAENQASARVHWAVALAGLTVLALLLAFLVVQGS